MKLTITQVTHYDKTKAGVPLIDKNRAPYMRAVIKTKEHGTSQLSGFVYRPLVEGQQIDADVTEELYNGQMQKKFKLIPKSAGGQNLDWLKADIVHIKRELVAIREMLLRNAPSVEVVEKSLEEEFPDSAVEEAYAANMPF